MVLQSARVDRVYPNCCIIFVRNKILEFKELKDPTRDILHSSDLLLIHVLVNYLHPSRRLLRVIKYLDQCSGYFYHDAEEAEAETARSCASSMALLKPPNFMSNSTSDVTVPNYREESSECGAHSSRYCETDDEYPQTNILDVAIDMEEVVFPVFHLSQLPLVLAKIS